jgi:hypothetical protein
MAKGELAIRKNKGGRRRRRRSARKGEKAFWMKGSCLATTDLLFSFGEMGRKDNAARRANRVG